MSLLSYRTTIPAKAYGAEPMTVAEIDAHPDSARLWATIRQMREDYSSFEDGDYPSSKFAGFGHV